LGGGLWLVKSIHHIFNYQVFSRDHVSVRVLNPQYVALNIHDLVDQDRLD
jgi:hypothetical protein